LPDDTFTDRFLEAELVTDEQLFVDDFEGLSATEADLESSGGSQQSSCVYEGDVLLGKYRVERDPNRRGSNILVDVKHLELASSLTLKYLAPDACSDSGYVKRLLLEARSASQVGGEHVACVVDAGRLEFGSPYLVRESLRGPDLAEVSKVHGPLPIVDAVDYIIQACEGVAEAHAMGIVHRNLRPTTLVATRRSDGASLVKVFDFAATEPIHVDPLTERAAALAGTSAVMSSLPYMAPEQIREPHEVDARADVYALGAILHELITGAPVFEGENAAALVAAIAADAPRSMRPLRPDVPSDLDDLVLACLAKNRAVRVSSLASLVLALRPFASRALDPSIARVLRLSDARAEPGLASRPERHEAADVPRHEPWRALEVLPQPAAQPEWLAQASHSEQNEPSVIPPVARSSPPPSAATKPARLAIWATGAGAAAVIAFVLAHHARSSSAEVTSRAHRAAALQADGWQHTVAAAVPSAKQQIAAATSSRSTLPSSSSLQVASGASDTAAPAAMPTAVVIPIAPATPLPAASIRRKLASSSSASSAGAVATRRSPRSDRDLFSEPD
jgi:serine/threonine-protein kinase